MMALQLVAPSAPLALRELPLPEPGAHDVIVRVAGCGVCHTDIGFWMDGVQTRHPPPITLGHEISGTVVEAGPLFTDLIGREVIVPSVIPCGQCDLCRSGRGNVCRAQLMPGNDMDGGFAEFVKVPGLGLCPVPERGGHDLAELSVIADAVTTPYQAVKRSGLRAGDLAIVVGVGGVGTHCVQIAAAVGARTVAIDVEPSALAGIEPYGASLTIDASIASFKEIRAQVRDAASDWGCAQHGWKIFECSGHPAGQETAYGLLNHAGILMLVGFTLEKVTVRLSNLMAFDATAQGTWGCLPELYPEALELVTGGKIALKPFIETFPLHEGPEVLRRVADHEMDRRAILVPDASG
ncbi:MAG: 6-hydroxycyclohex-1-ene-1-carbonyl-CoA dehydrogenase [Gemmatimonadota bacterium]|nr:6-hydroxycyclohex-1-ene-1-carbonyl-CoA dehydrogenase [Gemmatimonadota bacterium]MDH3423737.1 6-hydroxycyclohex-1-ene-1-carbonyl-CoA dehydrogenase [Gemmatimonadota bacterium]